MSNFAAGSTDAGTLALLEKLTRQNTEHGERLALLEFQNLLRELESGRAFDLEIDLPEDFAPPDSIQSRQFSAAARGGDYRDLKPLDVPLGRVASVSDPTQLPVFGIYCPDGPKAELARDFFRLLSEHHRQPFARMVFICETLVAVPFLGRYGFAIHHLNAETLDDVMPDLEKKFAISEVRALADAQLLWQPARP
jgi:hypothetical protein